MRSRTLLLTCLAIASPVALAQAGCAQAVVQSLADGRLDELTKRFADDSPQLNAALKQLRDVSGQLTRLEPASAARSGMTLRMTVARTGLPSTYRYSGLWLDAESSTLGPVSFHLVLTPGSPCDLLALHLNRQATR